MSDKQPFLKQIEGITAEVTNANQEAKDVAKIVEVDEDDLFVLSFAFNITTETKDSNSYDQKYDWRRCEPRSDFAVEVSQISRSISKLMTESGKMKGGQRHYERLTSWTEMAAENWKTIENYPDLVSFADVKEMKDNRILFKETVKWENMFLKDKMSDHNKIMEKLINANIDNKMIHVDGYIKNQEVVIRTKIREYFDSIKGGMKKKLVALAQECEFRRQLVKTYEGKIRDRVNCYFQEVMNFGVREIQSILSEASRKNGLAELELKMKEMLTQNTPFTKEEAEKEFHTTYKKVLSHMEDALDFGKLQH